MASAMYNYEVARLVGIYLPSINLGARYWVMVYGHLHRKGTLALVAIELGRMLWIKSAL